MIISTVKQLHTCTMSKGKLAKLKLEEGLSEVTDAEELKKEIADVLEHNGRVYGIYRRIDLKEQIEWGQIAGVEWEDELMYRKNLKDEKNKVGGMVPGYLLGFSIGFVLGYVTMDSLTLGICFGVSFACLWGSCGVAFARGTEIDTLDFIRREGKENAAL